MKEISEYYYNDESGRVAVIVQEDAGYFVHIKDKWNRVVSKIDVSEHSLRYAEDTAENYATGIVDYAK